MLLNQLAAFWYRFRHRRAGHSLNPHFYSSQSQTNQHRSGNRLHACRCYSSAAIPIHTKNQSPIMAMNHSRNIRRSS